MEAIVKEIQSVDNLNIVSFTFNDTTLSMMSLELKDEIKVAKKVELKTKATSIAIAKAFNGEISYSNQIPCKIESIKMGELLCSIKLQSHKTIFESIITTKSAKRLKLQVDDEVIALIKASELSISKVLDD